MGGYGSGGRRHGKPRVLADKCYTLSVADLRRVGIFKLTSAIDGKMKWAPLDLHMVIPADRSQIRLRIEREGERRELAIQLSQTAPHFGGVRYWLHCPLCGRRVVKLFFYPHLYAGERHLNAFWCRHCLGLSYTSRNCNHDWLSLGQRRAMQIKGKLKDPNEYWEMPPSKPKWMRRATYERHMQKFEAAIELANAGFVAGALRRIPGLAENLERFAREKADA